MDQQTKESAGKLLASVLTILATVITSNGIVDIRSADRVAAVHEEVTSVASQNSEILQGIAVLLDEKLTETEESGKKNQELNKAILGTSNTNKALNTKILDRLEKMQSQIDELKGAQK